MVVAMTQQSPWSPPEAPAPDARAGDPPTPPRRRTRRPTLRPRTGPPAGGRATRGPVVVAVLVAIIVVLLARDRVRRVSSVGEDDDGDGPSRPRRASREPAGRARAARRCPRATTCSPTMTDRSPSSCPTGGRRFSWTTSPCGGPVTGSRTTNPTVAGALATVDAARRRSSGQAFAAELDDADGFVANLNLLLAPRSSGTLAELAESDRLGLEQAGAQVGAARAVTIGDRHGLVVDSVDHVPARSRHRSSSSTSRPATACTCSPWPVSTRRPQRRSVEASACPDLSRGDRGRPPPTARSTGRSDSWSTRSSSPWNIVE